MDIKNKNKKSELPLKYIMVFAWSKLKFVTTSAPPKSAAIPV